MTWSCLATRICNMRCHRRSHCGAAVSRKPLLDAVAGLQGHVGGRIDKNPLGSAAGYGTPGSAAGPGPDDREAGFRARRREPVTSVQLSRGKAESTLLFEITLLLQDLGRMASGPAAVLYAGVRLHVALAADVTTGSSIMPQKRNPGCAGATTRRGSQCRPRLPGRVPDDYGRNCSPATSAICSASRRRCSAASTWLMDSVDIMAYVHRRPALPAREYRAGRGHIYATAEAYRLVDR